MPAGFERAKVQRDRLIQLKSPFSCFMVVSIVGRTGMAPSLCNQGQSEVDQSPHELQMVERHHELKPVHTRLRCLIAEQSVENTFLPSVRRQ